MYKKFIHDNPPSHYCLLVNLILTCLSGTETSLVLTPTSPSPTYSSW